VNKDELLLQRRAHRGETRGYVINFLLNFSPYARFMRNFLPLPVDNQDVPQVAMKAYLIGMAACIETFFRDLYLHILERNPDLIQQALASNSRRDSDAVITRRIANGVPLSEIVAAQVSFQSGDAIDRNFSIFFPGSTFFGALDDFELDCAIPSADKPGLAHLKLFPRWRQELQRIFALRHEFAHDGNSKTIIKPQEMRTLETTAILICQMAGYLEPLRNGYGSSSVEGVPAILLISDLIADDWELCGLTTAEDPDYQS
jgi:hypothetical protein